MIKQITIYYQTVEELKSLPDGCTIYAGEHYPDGYEDTDTSLIKQTDGLKAYDELLTWDDVQNQFDENKEMEDNFYYIFFTFQTEQVN